MKNAKKILTLGAIALLLCGCGKDIPTLSDGSQAVVNFKEGTNAISANELYEDLKESYALDSLLNLIDKKILEEKYASEMDSAKESAKNTLKSMKDSYGEDVIIQYYGSVARYESSLYLSALRQNAIKDYAKSLVKEDEIKSYYDKNVYDDIVVDHILITTGITDETTDEEKTNLENDAKNKIKEIQEKLDKADNKLEKFKELAKEYSKDEATKDNGGSLGAINTGTLPSSYDEILKVARNLKDGEYSKDLITTELGYHVIFRESTNEKPSLDDKKEEIINTLADEKIAADSTIQITAMDELRKEFNMNITDSEINKKYSNYIANSIANARNNQ